jgi:arsenite-transporting ATPase
MPKSLRRLPRDDLALGGCDMVGVKALIALFRPRIGPPAPAVVHGSQDRPALPGLDALLDAPAARGYGLVMGKGGVGKTTVADAGAVGLVASGHSVQLSTTDPAAQIARVQAGPGRRAVLLPWQAKAPVGIAAPSRLAA